ncbi:hypothetical protein ACQ86L_0425 (plasmid) [Leifsonia sp. P73]|uniref:hypothetical protein n=1 Tax=Leifsonia sp. TaxID=1870902 RepID=UPI003703B42B
MALSLTCKACGEVISGESEDDFVENAREHARGHGHVGPALTREHILARFEHGYSAPGQHGH